MNTQPLSDIILIERYQGGDANAIDDLLRRHSRTAYRYALRLTQHVEEAADLVSETFIRISRGMHRYQARSSFTTWMFTILRHCFYDSCLKNKRLGPVDSLDAAQDSEEGVVFKQLIDASESPYALAVRAEFTERMTNLMTTLPSEQQSVLKMYYGDHLSYKEISEILDIAEGTLKSRLHRARHSLRGWAQDDLFPEEASRPPAQSRTRNVDWAPHQLGRSTSSAEVSLR